MYTEDANGEVKLDKLTLSNSAEGRYENLWNQAGAMLKETNFDLRGINKTDKQYVQGVKNFCKHLAENTNITKFKNFTNKDVINFNANLVGRNYSPASIKPWNSGLQKLNKAATDQGLMKNKIQPASTILERGGVEQRIQGCLDKAWNDREYNEFRDLALAKNRPDVYNGMGMMREFGVRIQTLGKLPLGELNKALKTGKLTVKEKGGKVRSIAVTNTRQRQVLQDLKKELEGEKHKAHDKVFRDSSNLNRGRTERYSPSHKGTEQGVKQFITDNRARIQDTDRKPISKYKKGQSKKEVQKTQLTPHGLRHSFAKERYINYRKKGACVNVALTLVSRELGHSRQEVVKIYLAPFWKLEEDLKEQGVTW